ncbi:MAG: histone deacetylase [bacterium]
MPFIYSPRYYADIGAHVFPITKYRSVYRRLAETVSEFDFFEPEHAVEKELLLVHTQEYLDDLHRCALTERTAYSELPISKEIIDLFFLAAGGTILSCREALKSGWAVHIGGGFHHAFAARAEGFCYINDLAVAVIASQHESAIEKAAVIDCDLHQGNGTAAIFQGDESVYTFSMHQRDLYPVKEKSDLDIHLPNGVDDDEYLAHLESAIPKIFDDFKPELVLYQGGADPYEHDQLGNLKLTISGLKRRDDYIFRECKNRNIPIAATLGGGYAYNTEDTVEIHFNTCQSAMDIFHDVH